jgi:hypothetical protein
VVLVAPQWESRNLRGFLAAKGRQRGELVQLLDLDRPMLRYTVQLPAHLQPIHYEAGLLLLSQDQLPGRLQGASSR